MLKIFTAGIAMAILAFGQSFEAASIKPSDAPAGSGSGVDTDGAPVRMQNVTLKRFMMTAYGVPEAQILGVPKSMEDLRYDVIARADHTPGSDERMAMLQSLLAMRLSKVLVAPVVDMTNETRQFDFTLQWTPDDMQAKAAASDTSQGPSLFTALQEQLGLKLESRKVPVDVLIVDHVELPSED